MYVESQFLNLLKRESKLLVLVAVAVGLKLGSMDEISEAGKGGGGKQPGHRAIGGRSGLSFVLD